MLFRKLTKTLEEFLVSHPDKILLINGARQVGKSYLVRYVCKKLFKNYVEINLKEDQEGHRIFSTVGSTDDFYLQLGAIAGDKLGASEDTIVFLDEIQSYPHLMTLLKFLNQERRYRYIASGSQLGVVLAQTPSVPNMENRKKRVFISDIEQTKAHKQFSSYSQEFEYLTNSGVVIEVKAISNPKFPLRESEEKNLLKLYLNDVGLLTYLLYSNNINAILQDKKSIILGSVYETVVAQELNAHGFKMNYYDNKSIGEVDFLIDDYRNLTVLPLEVKSGKDYEIHRALDRFLSIKDYGITDAVVLSNDMPVYYCMFYKLDFEETDTIIPPMPIPGSL